jgi:hypothetical protein
MGTSGKGEGPLPGGSLQKGLGSLLKLFPDIPFPAASHQAADRLIYERYADDSAGWKRRAYYVLKPLIPRQIQLVLRRQYVAAQESRTSFPAWPIESTVVDAVEDFLRDSIEALGQEHLYRIAPWPSGTRFAFCITHDIEWDAGLRQAPRILEIELRQGFRSSWNLVPERYPIDWGIVDTLRQSGCEIGIHGLRHDGRLFQSRRTFFSRLEKIEGYARAWGATGFRSPSTLRNPGWMSQMQFEYDSSFPDTDPYEPQPGGCCTVWPYFLGRMVELPLTMPQDHTVYEILRRENLDLWGTKADWLIRVGGLVLINVHPDYMTSPARLAQYEEFLNSMAKQQGMWHALPAESARWWRDRDATVFSPEAGKLSLRGPGADRGGIQRAVLGGDQVHWLDCETGDTAG